MKRKTDESKEESDGDDVREEQSLEDAAQRVISFMHSKGEATLKEILEATKMPQRRVYDVLNVMGAVPNPIDPVLKKGPPGSKKYVFCNGAAWPPNVTLAGLESAIRNECLEIIEIATRIGELSRVLKEPRTEQISDDPDDPQADF